MKRIQKLIGLLLAFCMLFSMLPVTAQAAFSGSCGDNLRWTLDNGTLTISGTGPMDDYDFSDIRWGNYVITELIIEPGVTHIGNYAFYLCGQIKSVTIPSTVVSIGRNAFGFCDDLETVTFSEGLKEIQYHAFIGCLVLKSVTIPKSVTHIDGNVFRESRNLASIRVEKGSQHYSSDDKGVLYNKAKTELIACPAKLSGHYTIPSTVKTIGSSAFYEVGDLTGLTIPEGLKTIGSQAFVWTALETLTIPEGVTSVNDDTFLRCTKLTSIQLPDSLAGISASSFEDCANLRKILVKDTNPNYSNDAQGALYNKNKTKLIVCPEALAVDYVFPAGVTTIGAYAFNNCDDLTSINIPSTVTTIEDRAFSGCWVLEEAVIPNSVTTIGSYAFEDCSFTYIDLPKKLTEIATGAFRDCSFLRSVVIPEGVQSIGFGAFEYCSRLTSITIPNSVTVIEDWALADCENLWHIYFTGSEAQWNRIAMGENTLPENAKIHFNATDPTVHPDHYCLSLRYFVDAPGPDSWAHAGVDYCVENDLMNGTSNDLFSPGGVVSRAQLVTILYRASGSPWIESQGTFSDVPEGTWYSEAVEWAASEGIVQGIGGGKFGPDQNITREQIATILYRFEGSPKVKGNLNAFPDKGNVSDFAYDAMIWATSTGLINGVNANGVTTLAPQNNATRDQIASIIMRYLEAE